MSTINFACDKCGQKMRVGADKAGRKAKCTKCAAILSIPAATADDDVEEIEVVAGPPRRDAERSRRDDDDDDRPRRGRDRRDEDDDDDRPRRRLRYEDDGDEYDDRPSKRSTKTKWESVATGALINKIGAIVVFIGLSLVIVGLIIITISGFARSQGLLTAGVLVAWIGGVAMTLGHIPMLVGHFFFLSLSPKHGWGLALASLILLGTNVAFGLLNGILYLAFAPIAFIVSILSFFLVGAHMIVVGLTFAKVGQFRDKSLISRGKTTMIFGCVFLGYWLLFGLFMMVLNLSRAGGPTAGILSLILIAIGTGITFGMYLTYMLSSSHLRSAALD